MLSLLEATRFDGRISSEQGKTMPWLLAGEAEEGDSSVEVVAKLSGSCDLGIKSLIVEALSALLAADLGLPVPEPFLVVLSDEFIDAVHDVEAKAVAERSCSVAFGSRRIENCAILPRGYKLEKEQVPQAASIFAFDGAIENADRRCDKPNCLLSDSGIAIIDHELAFPAACGLHLFSRLEPWKKGALREFTKLPGTHIFYENLKGNKALDFATYIGRWNSLKDDRFDAYLAALPQEWQSQTDVADAIVSAMREIKSNMTQCIEEVSRVL
ncbi:hypothetical protein MACH10_13150 [Thalassospira tepidiphila]|uniref:HipA family kinase n=1 Tax=Thalassospira tepidiphila TaxID=393657 RepID=UPI00291EEF6C|nr:hypothetical protein MACH10_13150 [Thalassospira tepidiphila]